MNGSNLQKILCHRCGDEWEQRFVSKRHGIDETVITKVPRLLPEETIMAIRKKSGERNSWDKKGQKHPYLFARVIFDADTGKALTGTCNAMGKRYYKPYQGAKRPRYQVNADVLEKAVLEELYLALGSKASLQRAVFDGHPLGKVADKYQEDLESKQDELAQVERQLEGYVTAIGTTENVAPFMERIMPRVIELESRSKGLKDQIAGLKYRLATLPTDREIEDRREMWAQLLARQNFSYLESGAALHQLPFEYQKKIIRLFFGGKDEAGRRYGIYVQDLGGKAQALQIRGLREAGGRQGMGGGPERGLLHAGG
ncbi:MAG: hypothetical protein WBV23_04305 [Desulfobaccales bacterium]